jgi:hypothetical protein
VEIKSLLHVSHCRHKLRPLRDSRTQESKENDLARAELSTAGQGMDQFFGLQFKMSEMGAVNASVTVIIFGRFTVNI